MCPSSEPLATAPSGAPASFAQQGLLFLHELRGGSCEYHIVDAFQLEGPLDRAALQTALDGIVRRHEILRTGFTTCDGEPLQMVAPHARAALAVEARPRLTEAERDRCVEQAVMEEWTRPFALDAPPLLRVRLLAFAERSHVLLTTLHHVVADGWSLSVLRRELAHGYAAARDGCAAAPPPPAVQYGAFATWQRRHLDEAAAERDLAYWRRRLARLPTELGLPFDRPRRVSRPPLVRLHRADTPPPLVRRLRELGAARGATLYMTLLAAYAVLLWRCSGQRDVVVASPIAGRERADVEQSIGLFVNTLVMRLAVEPELAFERLLDGARRCALEAYEHQRAPFERVVQALSPERRLDRPPVAQVLLALQNAPSSALLLAGLDVRELPLTQARSRLDLELHATEDDDRLLLRWVHDGNLFDESTIVQLASRYLRLLTRIADDPSARVADLLDPLEMGKDRCGGED
jgi:hypothetical protein